MNPVTYSWNHVTIPVVNTATFISMTASELKDLSVGDLLAHANSVLDLYIIASVDPKNRKLAVQRESDLIKLHKIITEKRESEKPLK